MSQQYRILIASDDSTCIATMRQALTQTAYEINTVDSGTALITEAVKSRADLMIVDMGLASDGTASLYRDLKENSDTAGIPIVFLIDPELAGQKLEEYQIEEWDYLAKPVTAKDVLSRVNHQAELHRMNVELRARQEELLELNNKLAQLARRDPLTNLLNRHAWDEMVIQQHELFERYGHPYSVVMIDLDNFREYNDTHGHQAGDACLRQVADAITNVCRRVDSVSRYGGEEFAVLAPETDAEKAIQFADRIRRAIWGIELTQSPGASPVRMSASIGVAVSSASSNWEDILRRAENALQVAQRTGRNMVYADRSTGQETQPTSTVAKEGAESKPENFDDHIEVLVVDDDPTNRAVCKGCLVRAGYRIREAADGCEALTQVGICQPDVILMDVMMPNMDGLECTKALRANPETRDIPIIILSALARTEDILAGLQAGADEYLSKPIRSSELALRVKSMSRLQRERINLLHSYEERGRQMRVLTRMVEFCRAVGLCRRIDEVLQQTVEVVSDIIDCRRVSIMLPDPTEQILNIASAIGLDETVTRSTYVRPGAPIAGQVFSSGQAIVVNTEAEAGVCPGDYDAPYFASVPLMSAPLDAAGRVVGVLNATEKQGGVPFQSRDLEYIELISKVAGTTIHDIRMREARDQASDSIMVGLASLAECRDNDTGKHLERVTRFCLMLARTLQEMDEYRGVIDDEFLYNLERSVPLHDIGKVAIPDNILLYPGRLNEEQMAIMRTHAEAGASTIESLIPRAPGVRFLEMAVEIARHHHERYDGKGYPDQLSGKGIPLPARIAAIADVYDALTTRRVYKEAFSHEKATTIILEGSGTAFDPDIVEAFVQCEKEFEKLAKILADETEPKEEWIQPPLSVGV